MRNFNISSLFSSLGSSNLLSSINFSDYASIRNGSYGKLLKAHYAEEKKTTASSKPATDKKNDPTVKNTGLAQLKKESDSLKTAAENLKKEDLWKQTDGKYNMDKIADAIKTFAGEYNDTLAKASQVTPKAIATDVKYMKSMTATMSNALSKVGITIGFDGSMSVNEEKLKTANGSSVKSLFSGATSYGAQIAQKASEISRDTIRNTGVISSNGSLFDS
ncbi:MAG: hypothetical protein PUD20_08190, partial [bacterium]|nr:hypothetical protein [bacterium]